MKTRQPADQGDLAACAEEDEGPTAPTPSSSGSSLVKDGPIDQKRHVSAEAADIPALRTDLDQRITNLRSALPVIDAHLAKAQEAGRIVAPGDKPVATLASSAADADAARALIELAPQFRKALEARRGKKP